MWEMSGDKWGYSAIDPSEREKWYNTQWFVWWIMHRQQTDKNGKVRYSAAYPTGRERFCISLEFRVPGMISSDYLSNRREEACE